MICDVDTFSIPKKRFSFTGDFRKDRPKLVVPEKYNDMKVAYIGIAYYSGKQYIKSIKNCAQNEISKSCSVANIL